MYGMLKVCEGAPVGVSGLVFTDRPGLAPCAADKTVRAAVVLQVRLSNKARNTPKQLCQIKPSLVRTYCMAHLEPGATQNIRRKTGSAGHRYGSVRRKSMLIANIRCSMGVVWYIMAQRMMHGAQCMLLGVWCSLRPSSPHAAYLSGSRSD